MRWLEHDEVSEERLPDWAQQVGEPLGSSLSIHREGLVHRRSRRATAMTWADVLTVVSVGLPRRCLICAPRKPPKEPWIEVKDEAVAERLPKIFAERRLGLMGYRGGPAEARVRLSPPEVLDRVLRREQIPGAVEVLFGRSGPSLFNAAVTGSAVGAGALIPMAVALIPFGGLAILAGTAGAGLIGATGYYSWESYRHARRGRVLVMTPDAFVGGLDGGAIRAFGWEQIREFRAGFTDQSHLSESLEVIGAEGEMLARVPERFFGVELEVIVAIAQAYGDRARRALGIRVDSGPAGQGMGGIR